MIAVDRAVWTIHNKSLQVILDGEIKESKVSDKKFSPGGDIWTGEIPMLRFKEESYQEEYNSFNSDLMMLFSDPLFDKIFIDAKIGEESEYGSNILKTPLIIRKIEEYTVDEIIEQH